MEASSSQIDGSHENGIFNFIGELGVGLLMKKKSLIEDEVSTLQQNNKMAAFARGTYLYCFVLYFSYITFIFSSILANAANLKIGLV